MAKIVVTGGLGYIGAHTVVELQTQGYDVVILDNLSNSEYLVLDGITAITGIAPAFEKINVCDKEALHSCLVQHAPIDAIIHFAAYKAVGESVQDSLLYYHNNVCGMVSVLECMRELSIPHLVFSSSCTVYGQPEKLPVTEQAELQPATSPYGNTKQICEQIIRDAITSYNGISACMLRYFNPIGAHKSALIGELPKGVPNNLLPFITQTAAGVRQQLQVFGDNYNTPDGSAIRDYIYVVDLAQAHVSALDRLLSHNNNHACEVFNLGTGTGISVFEMITAFEQATGISIPYNIAPRRAGDIEQVWADSTYANTQLQWHARTPLQEVLLSAWNWEKSIRNL
jgi:UDP-glucose 4-epimerase